MGDEEDSVVWENSVDQGIWAVKVVRIAPYQGKLTVTHVALDKMILETEVGLAYDAVFGPDVADVAMWQESCIEAIDGSGLA